MMKPAAFACAGWLLLWGLLVAAAFIPYSTKAAGVTVITHGFDGDVTGWITAMADAIPGYFHARYPGLSTNVAVYTVTLTTDGSNYYYQWARDSGGSPTNSDTGEIIIKLDWSQMSGGPGEHDVSTYTVAAIASSILMQTDSIPDLGGHALAEYPLHLIGHSRGGSLVNQMSYILGTNGIWVDQLTTLDPHPFNNDGNSDPGFPDDASANETYENVLFRDNDWQDMGNLFDPDGEPASGAYNRQLSDLSGGYQDVGSISPYHSNVHLWYYGTIDLTVPATYDDDGETVTISAAMRSAWWAPYENSGANAGFYYSLIGGGNRTTLDRPLGLPSDPAIVDGYNQYWDLGAGTNINRTALPINGGTWPDIIKFDVNGTNEVARGDLLSTTLYFQYAGTSNLTLRIYFDPDLNPNNSNSVLAVQMHPPATGAGSVYNYADLGIATANVPPGDYAVYGEITDGIHTRFLYAPEMVQILPAQPPPVLSVSMPGKSQFIISVSGFAGRKIVLQSSTDLQSWQAVATNTLTSGPWAYTNNTPFNSSEQFYRATVAQ